MNSLKQYEQVIKEKLDQVEAPDVQDLWADMEARLEKEMPQQEENKRRVLWMFGNKTLLISASLVLLFGCAYTFSHLTQTVVEEPQLSSTEMKRTSAKTSNELLNHDETEASKGQSPLATYNSEVTGSFESELPAKEQTSDEFVLLIDQPTVDATDDNEFLSGTVTPAVPIQAQATSIKASPLSITSPKAENFSLTYPEIKKPRIVSDKGYTVGLSMQHAFALGGQQRADFDMKGRNNRMQDYIPSAYIQYHINKKMYVQVEAQPVSAQYTPSFTLYNRVDSLNPDEKEERLVKLNKLFYLNLPVSFHYSPVKNLTIGVGAQYSRLKKVVLQDREIYHLIGAGGWNISDRKNETVVRDNKEASNHNSGDVVDSVAQSFRTNDLRALADINYNYKGISLGVRYTQGLNNYVNTNFTNLQVKDKNQSLQLYLKYNLFDSRKK